MGEKTNCMAKIFKQWPFLSFGVLLTLLGLFVTPSVESRSLVKDGFPSISYHHPFPWETRRPAAYLEEKRRSAINFRKLLEALNSPVEDDDLLPISSLRFG
ncbi:hypothetical protein X801_01096 [Opisthorchis viverrini]|uniref:Uncharacterized protein n=2 Tax=Opisthorchis viverrini TaxID=6198 RepID=A0A1S8X8C1_OPIVI|nr:hypothetical protein T265_08408 [Opisthorchis viverrini]KER23787.1 hypothetical protein T265_08408 [Opisthorchis viverrini]OON22995.1 hypothetical protein X801_01096 [Opisthorchis viverrini]